jgi:lipopolysaccharide exporter
MSNKRKAIDGGKWITISTMIATVLQFVQISILAKLLEPAAFGLVSVSILITNFFHLVSDLGFSNSIIYKQENDRKTLSTLYWLSLGLGLLAFLLIRAGAPLAVAYYHEPRLDEILRVSAWYFPIVFAGQTYLFLLQRDLRFRDIALIEIITNVTGAVVSVGLAMNGWREMALIYGGLISRLVQMVLLIGVGFRLFRPEFYFNLSRIGEHFRFGIYNVGEGLLYYFQTNIDNILIGGLLGVKALGFYTVAYQLAVFPITKLNPIILQVAYPVLAKMKDDNAALKRAYLQILDLVSYLNLPLLAGLFITADRVVPLIYGPGWEPAIALIRIFVFAAFFHALAHPLFTLAFTKGKPKLLFFLNLTTLALKIPLLYVFAHFYGQTGVAVSFLLTNFIVLALNFGAVHSLIGRFLGEFLTTLAKPLAFSLAMVSAVAGYQRWQPDAGLVNTGLQIALGGLLYAGLTLRFKIPLREVRTYVQRL